MNFWKSVVTTTLLHIEVELLENNKLILLCKVPCYTLVGLQRKKYFFLLQEQLIFTAFELMFLLC